VQIIPAAPSKAIEYFGAQRLSGRVSALATLSSGTVSGLTWYSPLPTTGGFQQVISTLKTGSLATSTPFSQPVVVTPKLGSVSEQMETSASSVRINAASLRGVAFSAYGSLPSSASVWLRPETLIQSKSTDVTTFVAQSLPSNYRTTMKPYDAVQRLFKAVVAKIRYTTTTSRPDAVSALRTGLGDCGFFSALFVASCRNIGVPARAVCGMTKGDNAWHVWSEFWMPGYGWVPVDAAYSDGLCPDGSLALYFGVIPELNSRVALTYGFDHTVGSLVIPMLQSPAVWANSTTKVSSVQAFSSLSPAAGF
jgi:transglutaminase-like putative cysteine protease